MRINAWLVALGVAWGPVFPGDAQSSVASERAGSSLAEEGSKGPECALQEDTVPRGGKLVVTGERFGNTPLVLIAGRPARILHRQQTLIAVQVHPDSDGGSVTLKTAGEQVLCGVLNIVGKN